MKIKISLNNIICLTLDDGLMGVIKISYSENFKLHFTVNNTILFEPCLIK